MSPKTAFPINSLPATNAFQSDGLAKCEESTETSDNSLFEHFAWLYIFCREKLFRDDTARMIDRKSTRLNSSHVSISYAVFCLKKKKTNNGYRDGGDARGHRHYRPSVPVLTRGCN